MPRYDVPKLADYSGALNANNSMIQAFANLGKTSQDYLNYDKDKKHNVWYEAFKQQELDNTKDYQAKDLENKAGHLATYSTKIALDDENTKAKLKQQKEVNDAQIKYYQNGGSRGKENDPLKDEINKLKIEEMTNKATENKVQRFLEHPSITGEKLSKEQVYEAVQAIRNGKSPRIVSDDGYFGSGIGKSYSIVYDDNKSFAPVFNNPNSNSNINNTKNVNTSQTINNNNQNATQVQAVNKALEDIKKTQSTNKERIELKNWSKTPQAQPFLEVAFKKYPNASKGELYRYAKTLEQEDLKRKKGL